MLRWTCPQGWLVNRSFEVGHRSAWTKGSVGLACGDGLNELSTVAKMTRPHCRVGRMLELDCPVAAIRDRTRRQPE